MLRDDAPEGAGVRRADRLALVEDAGAAGEQRRVDDVRVADHPADIGGRPEHFSRPHDAEITITGRASSMRLASSCGAKPPNTTECTAPIRAHASIATTASGTIGM